MPTHCNVLGAPSDSPVDIYLCGRNGSTLPCNFAVSGAPSPLVDFSGSLAGSVECFVSVFDSPACLPDCELTISPGVLEAAA